MDWGAWWALGVYVATLVLPFVMLFIVPGGRKPSSAIAWLLVIAILPWVGFVLFIVLGHPRLPRQHRRRIREAQHQLAAAMDATVQDPDATWLANRLSEDQEGIEEMVRRLGALPPFDGNEVQLLDDYDATLQRIAADIEGATRFVHVQSYIFALDGATQPIVDAMARAAQRGVSVRVLLDHLGSRPFGGHRTLLSSLRQAGIEAAYTLPFQPWRGRVSRPDLRNHRKTVIIDGDIGYIGSLNLIDRHYRKHPQSPVRFEYLEVTARTRGPIVQQLDAVFRTDWYAETGKRLHEQPLPQVRAGDAVAQVLPSGPGHAGESNLRVFNALVYSATRRIVIVNAYFVPDETLMMALTTAAHRGVDVHLVTPEKGNQWLLRLAQRSYYEDLLRAGVHIHLHPRPWNLHSKTMTIDDGVCVVGSSNLDIRSFELNLETSLICYDASVVDSMRRIETRYMDEATRLDLEAWRRTSTWSRAVQNVARLTSALQ